VSGDSAASILVVDDTPANLGFLIETLSQAGYRVRVATDGETALEQARYAPPSLVLMDAMMPGIDGFETTRRMRGLATLAQVPVIFMTALSESQDKVRAFAAGANDYVTKPFQHEEVLARVQTHIARRALERELERANAELETRVVARTRELQDALAEVEALKVRLQQENQYLKREISESVSDAIVGRSPGLQHALAQVALVAPTDATVLIRGETGTGKEMIARAVHDRSERRDGPLVKLNCSAISAGLVESELFGHVKGAFTGAHDRRVGRFELANGGTLFLDEVSELPPDTQAKLLRVLQEREFEPVGSSKTLKVNVRVVAASNRDLAADSRSGRFRADLYYRLNVFPIDLPSLRERRDDIPLLATHFMQRAARKLGKRLDGIEPGSMRRLVEHGWPGNIRDLQNVIERAAILADGAQLVVNWELGPTAPNNATNPAPARPPAPAAAAAASNGAVDSGVGSLALQALERRHIVEVLRKTRGVIEGPRGAAELLKLKPSTARFRIRKLGIQRSEYISN
jgi:formate hydrogenlyase transcriptional activator